MYLVDPRAYAQRLLHPRAWLLAASCRHRTGRSQQPAPSRFDYLEASITGSVSTAFKRRRAKELDSAFRNGDISYEDACLEMEQLDDEP